MAGAVLLAHDGEVVFAQAYGLANREQGTANTLDTAFRIGSMSKMFAGTAIVQLVQAGKVSLDAPLGTYLSDYPNADTAKVTIAQPLTHTGGTGDTGGAPGMGGSLWICPESGYVVTVLGNVDPEAVIRISDFIINRLPTSAE